jgi:proteasome regulatory subunit
MVVSHEPDLPNDNTDESTKDYEDLQQSYDALRETAVELEQELEEAQRENRDLRKAVERMKRENKALKSTPQFVGSVEEILDEKLILKKHGDNQEFMTQIPPQIDLEPGDRVSLNDSMSVVEKIDTKETDSRAKAMQVDGEPDVSYEDIGGLDEELVEVRETVEDPLLHPERFDDIGIEPPSGVLLHGSPGTGKTLMAKAVANKTDATFLKLAASELARKFIGEGSRLVRDLFEVADENSPAVIFIDEIDAIAAKRNQSKSDGGAEVQRTLMQLLSEMDGFDDRSDIRIIAATNRFDMLDDAILRPGRFDRIIEVPPPEAEGRKQILQIHTRDMNLDDDVDFESLSSMTEKFTGADIQATCTEAGMNAVRDGRSEVNNQDFVQAVEKVQMEDNAATKLQGYQ